MPRNYQRLTKRRSYTQNQLNEALQKCRNGTLTIKACAERYRIPRETLRDHLKGRRGKRGPTVGGGGGPTALPAAAESELAECLRIMAKWGFGLSRTEVMDLVEVYIKSNNIKSRFKNGRPGEDWWLSFKKRHHLSIRKPEPLEHTRNTQTNPFTVYGFFDLLEATISELNLAGKPQQIWNCDETSFCHDPNKTKVVSEKGKICHRYTAGSGRENTSVLACVSAAGEKLAPLVIFKGKNLWESWIPNKEDFPNTSYAATPRGWMT